MELERLTLVDVSSRARVDVHRLGSKVWNKMKKRVSLLAEEGR